LCLKADFRDTLETIDHSSGDVAYLRITAHSEEKRSNTPLRVLSPPVFDPEFQAIYHKVKALPPIQVPGRTDISMESSISLPRLVQIGDGTYVVDSISSASDSSAEIQVRYCLDKLICNIQVFLLIVALLHKNHLQSKHIISVVLLLNDMSDFTAVNPVYATYFTSPLPPSRVTVSVGLPDKVRLSTIISTQPRTGLHVQSRSYWAPANIGPYSQSISVSHLLGEPNIRPTPQPF
jgi:diphthine-ammonia ligase